jgi:FKBP-type peptidyl-prolyl cis-trans isomerase FklB
MGAGRVVPALAAALLLSVTAPGAEGGDATTAGSAFATGEAKAPGARKKVRSADENRKAGEAFLAENGKKEGVVTLPSGLQYRVLREGTGRTPTDGDTVECRYRATSIDGVELDRSARSGAPSVLIVSRLAPGFREALLRMKAGSSWRLCLPPRLAYGERGNGRIAPWTTVLLEVELVAVR